MAATLGGHIAWVTGASSGIGRACAVELAKRGATIAVSARRAERLDELVAELRAKGATAMAVACDVTDDDEVAKTVARIVEVHGDLHIALANAGCSVAGSIEELTGDEWRRQLNVNVVGAALTARHALPHLMKTKGRIGLTGSVASYMAAPGYGAYHASKYALRALGETLSLELAGTGVSCTTLHPGFVESEIMQVDNRGELHESKPDKRPTQLMWSAENAAEVMIDAMVKRRRSYVFTAHGKLGAWVGQHLPSLMHAVMSSRFVDQSGSFRTDD